MNIGLGLLLLPIGIIFIISGILSRKKNGKIVGNGLLLAGSIMLSLSILLITGIYDPYANHIR
ncbi:hypothetical protein BCI9360_01600 [Bacillus sp. CECT 9360]|nr:hypothetical protein BCI9360_01600 [Bacillus sp. CECT 9360]